MRLSTLDCLLSKSGRPLAVRSLRVLCAELNCIYIRTWRRNILAFPRSTVTDFNQAHLRAFAGSLNSSGTYAHTMLAPSVPRTLQQLAHRRPRQSPLRGRAGPFELPRPCRSYDGQQIPAGLGRLGFHSTQHIALGRTRETKTLGSTRNMGRDRKLRLLYSLSSGRTLL